MGNLAASRALHRFYRLEEEVIFRRSWIAISRVDQVAKPGDYCRCDLEGTPLIAVRGQENEVRVLSGSCLHRYMPTFLVLTLHLVLALMPVLKKPGATMQT